MPLRRLDILCYQTETVRPLLLIECKGTLVQEGMFSQIMGYNALIQAPLVCLVGQTEWIFQWNDPKRSVTFKGLPTYQTLCDEAFQ